MATTSTFSNKIVQNSVVLFREMLPFIRDEKHRKGRSGCVQILDTKTCQARKAEDTNSRTNSGVKYATARGHLKNCLDSSTMTEVDTEYDRAKVPPYNGSDDTSPLEV